MYIMWWESCEEFIYSETTIITPLEKERKEKIKGFSKRQQHLLLLLLTAINILSQCVLKWVVPTYDCSYPSDRDT